MNTDLLLACFVASVALAVVPGPAIFYVAAQSLGRGRRAGVLAALGVHLGGWVHVAAAVAGLSALMVVVPEVHLALRLGGAAFLLWMAWTMVRDSGGEAPTLSRPARRAFLDSILVEVLNPKVALFFIAFLPQFVDPSAGWSVPLQLLVLGAMVNAVLLAMDMSVALAAGHLRLRVLGTPGAMRWLRRASGAVLAGLGLRLAIPQG